MRSHEILISIQQDINELQNWAKTWQMSFNYEKNTENEYTMDMGENLIPHKIEKTLVERDLGILLSSNLGPIKLSRLLKRLNRSLPN